MDWNTVLETGAAVIVGFGGAGAIIAGVAKFTADKIAAKLEKKYELKFSTELEPFKCRLKNKSYVSKARFDAEFEIHRQLSATSIAMVKEISRLSPPVTSDTGNDDETYKRQYDTALKKAAAFQDALAANAPFISKKVYLMLQSLEEKSRRQLDDFADLNANDDVTKNKEVLKRTKELQSDVDAVIQELREYLADLDVL